MMFCIIETIVLVAISPYPNMSKSYILLFLGEFE